MQKRKRPYFTFHFPRFSSFSNSLQPYVHAASDPDERRKKTESHRWNKSNLDHIVAWKLNSLIKPIIIELHTISQIFQMSLSFRCALDDLSPFWRVARNRFPSFSPSWLGFVEISRVLVRLEMKPMETLYDLIEEAKLRTLWWALCIFTVSYFLTRKRISNLFQFHYYIWIVLFFPLWLSELINC